MDSNIKVTIGIPFYNAEKYLGDAIQSVVNQTYIHWELILLDDGSTDGSLDIAKSFKDNRIHLITDGENKGLIFRLNQLTSLVSGEYYARMDADDIMHFDRIAIQLDYLKSNPEVDVIGTDYYSIDINNEIIGRRFQNTQLNSVESVLKNGCFAHPTVMGRISWFKNNQYNKDWERMEDVELWVRTVSYSNFKNIQEPLLFYRNVGIPTLAKYLKSNMKIIKLLQKRKKYQISFLVSISYSVIYFFKIILYIFFYCIGQMDFLIKKRSQTILESEKIIATNLLKRSITN